MSNDQHGGGEGRPNALIHETSPYLLQHAYNPVDWQPWSEAALERARREHKPILLSIGYSACHWCHVMAHESFEDAATAEVMNEHFVNIKVDREERPDLDKIYQIAHQLLTRHGGGWPLTLFLTPDDRVPFFGGTYFPPAPRYGMPAFRTLLQQIASAWHKDEDAIRRQNVSFMEAMASLEPAPAEAGTEPDAAPLSLCVDELAQNFDHENGGFSGAPKFPHCTNIEFLLQQNARQCGGDRQRAAVCLDMAGTTLQHMAAGGIYDHLGGGFCRYAVDERWLIPHFEKMLYDNGPLLGVYADAFHHTGDPGYRQVAAETAAWVIRDMQSPDGGYYSSLDADSEGEEGRFYVWTPEEVKSVLSEEEYPLFARRYGLDQPANFEDRWHLYLAVSVDAAAQAAGVAPERAEALLKSAREKLLDVRNRRVWPGRDEKILTAWNALMIRGMAVAHLRLGEPQYLDSAEKALAFIEDNLWRDGHLLATARDGRAHLNAYLDDYAFLIDALLQLLQCRWENSWLEFALALADTMLAQFYDADGGGFYFTSRDHESLLLRRKDFMDDSLPSGNGVAARALLHLGHLSGRTDYLDAAAHTLRAAWPALQKIPHGHTALLQALQDYVAPPAQAVIRGPAAEIKAWHTACLAAADLNTGVYTIPAETGGLPGLLADMQAGDGPAAFICAGTSCRAPERDLTAVTHYLKQPVL